MLGEMVGEERGSVRKYICKLIGFFYIHFRLGSIFLAKNFHWI